MSAEDQILVTAEPHLLPSSSEEANPSFNAALIKLYAYFLSSFYLSSSSSGLVTASPGPSSILLFPISVTGSWIESSLQNSSYLYLPSAPLSSSVHKAFWSTSPHTLTDLILPITQHFSVSHYFMSLQDMKSKSLLSWDHCLSDCTYLPLLPAQQQLSLSSSSSFSYHRKDSKLFPEKSYFLISPHYSFGLRESMREVIRCAPSLPLMTHSSPVRVGISEEFSFLHSLLSLLSRQPPPRSLSTSSQKIPCVLTSPLSPPQPPLISPFFFTRSHTSTSIHVSFTITSSH
jgi:hypothetical protein